MFHIIYLHVRTYRPPVLLARRYPIHVHLDPSLHIHANSLPLDDSDPAQWLCVRYVTTRRRQCCSSEKLPLLDSSARFSSTPTPVVTSFAGSRQQWSVYKKPLRPTSSISCRTPTFAHCTQSGSL